MWRFHWEMQLLQNSGKIFILSYFCVLINCDMWHCHILGVIFLLSYNRPYIIWWIFTPCSEFLIHQDNFSPRLKNVRNTIIVANANIFRGRKILPPLANLYPQKLSPSKNALIRVIHVNFYSSGNPGIFLLDLNSYIFTPRWNFLTWQ